MSNFFTGRFQNARVSVKVFVAPVLITVFMLAMAAAAQYGAKQQSDVLSQFANQTMPKSMAAVRASDFAVTAHLDLYRTINWAANSQDEKKIEEGIKQTTANLKRAKDELAGIATRWTLSGEDAAQRDAAAVALEKYTEAAVNVLDMASSDAATAFIFLLAVEKSFDTVKERFDGLRDVQARQTETTSAAAFESEERMRVIFLTLLGVALLLAAVVTVTVARLISRPIVGMTQAMAALAGGDQSTVIPGTDRKDEIGRMAGAVQVFKTNMIEAERLRAEQAEAERAIASAQRAAEEREATLKHAAEEKAASERKAAMRTLADQFEKAVGNIVQTVSSASTELEAAANTLAETAETTQQLSAVVATASNEASANVQSVASATEEMSGSVREISRQVHESSRIAGEAVTQAQKTNARIADLSQAAGRIGDVVKLITAVAEQTNLLALNATIEAARAGEAGKGFAVVASEVKLLAAQTAKATEEISTQIAGMQAATQDSVAAIKEIGGTIGRISEIAATIAAAVEEQGAATAEISRNVQQASDGTGQVATNIVSVNRGAAETSSASSQVLSSARSLSSESSHLKIEVDKFLETVRAA